MRVLCEGPREFGAAAIQSSFAGCTSQHRKQGLSHDLAVVAHYHSTEGYLLDFGELGVDL